MQNTVRTTIRIRKDLLDQSKLVALKRGTTLQKVINEALQVGMQRVGDVNSRKRIFAEIDKLRNGVNMTSEEVQDLVAQNKRELQDRADRILGHDHK